MNNKINVMVNGLPGKMAKEVLLASLAAEDLALIGHSLTGPEINYDLFEDVLLIRPDSREKEIGGVKKNVPDFISVDYTQPDTINSNADFYCRHELPFVIGTTGGDRKALEQRVRDSQICAVIAPNMAKQIVALQDFISEYATFHTNEMIGCGLEVIESHQQGKKDTSGTAKAMVQYFNKMGIPFDINNITMIRDPEKQKIMGVPTEYLGGHGWHTYILKPTSHESSFAVENFGRALMLNLFFNNPALKGYNVSDGKKPYETLAVSPDGNVLLSTGKTNEGCFKITHNINGRSVYVDGTLDAIRFLDKKVKAGEKGKAYSMIDVLRAN